MSSSVTEYLERLQKLTKTNLDILQAINDSFFTKREHLVVNVDEQSYVFPSFIYLENKINALQEGFNNLVYAPKTGEATFNFDGNSQTIELKGFTSTPNSLSLNTVSNFNVLENSIFKDFVTPNPYVRFGVASLPNDITTVNVKKVVAKSQQLKDIFNARVTDEQEPNRASVNISFADMFKILSIYERGVDYIEYDTVKSLPIHKAVGSGMYIIKSIDSDVINDDLTELYTVTVSGELKYKLFDETIEKYLQAGDCLVTYDDSAKLKIVEVRRNTSQLVLQVENGDYLNLVADTGDDSLVSDYSKLKFFSPIDFDDDKYVDVTLEEDQFIVVFVAPLNSRMNIQSSWGTGVLFDTDKLTLGVESYREYYNRNVNNIGDTLKEITSIMTNGITKYTKEQYDAFTGYKPVIVPEDLSVVMINKHLNDSPTVQNIRSLYAQKLQYQTELGDIQKQIDDINTTLASINFDDTTNLRTVYESQLKEYNKKRNEVVTALNSIISEIASAANNSVVPIENAKYHIRGFFNWKALNSDTIIGEYIEHIKGIRVYYRYKNQDQETGNADSINNNIYSDWIEMSSIRRKLFASCSDTGDYSFEREQDNSNLNVPSFNQIDIPISQGETVDIKLQIVWDFGYPFIDTFSDWSEIYNAEFPEEYNKNVQILDIIAENNNDIETNRFKNILVEEGVRVHVDDKLIDQDITYFHQPEHIASGFYTSERRVIPLKDKLSTMYEDILKLQDEVLGNSANNLRVTVDINSVETIINRNQENAVYTNIIDSLLMNLSIANNSNRPMKLYSIIPGPRDRQIDTASRYSYYGAKIVRPSQGTSGAIGTLSESYQSYNQFIYFRSLDLWDGTSQITAQCKPYLLDKYALCLDSDSKFDYIELQPGESIIIPFKFSVSGDNVPESKVQFDLRTTLYRDPVTYEFTVYNDTANEATLVQKAKSNLNKYNPIVISKKVVK